MARTDVALSSRVPAVIAAFAEAKGLDVKALLARHRLPLDLGVGADGRAETTIHLSALRALYEDVAQALGDPHVGLSMAQAVPRGSYGVAEFVVRSASVLRAAFENFVRLTALVSPGLRFAFEERGDDATLSVSIPLRGPEPSHHPDEYVVGILVTHLRLLSPGVRLSRVWFVHPRPPASEAVEAFFGCPVTWDAPSSGFVVPRTALDAPVPTGDPALHAWLSATAERALAQRPRSTELAATLRHHLTEALGQGEPSIERVAVRMHLSARTLQRRLADLQTNFQEVLDGVRYDLARGYLGDRRLDVSQVAYLLGYSDLRAFNRAFKRWTGAMPTQWRTQAPVTAPRSP